MGRNMTMSPLEVAKAFNAPLLAAQDSNAEVKELVEKIGSRTVQYGAVSTTAFQEETKYGRQNWEVGRPLRVEIMEPTFVHSLASASTKNA